MIKIINIIENDYDVEYRLKSTWINEGEFIGHIEVKKAFETIYTSDGEHHWSDLLQFGKAIIDDEQDWEEYDLYIGGKRFKLSEIIGNRRAYENLMELIGISSSEASSYDAELHKRIMEFSIKRFADILIEKMYGKNKDEVSLDQLYDIALYIDEEEIVEEIGGESEMANVAEAVKQAILEEFKENVSEKLRRMAAVKQAILEEFKENIGEKEEDFGEKLRRMTAVKQALLEMFKEESISEKLRRMTIEVPMKEVSKVIRGYIAEKSRISNVKSNAIIDDIVCIISHQLEKMASEYDEKLSEQIKEAKRYREYDYDYIREVIEETYDVYCAGENHFGASSEGNYDNALEFLKELDISVSELINEAIELEYAVEELDVITLANIATDYILLKRIKGKTTIGRDIVREIIENTEL